MSEADDTVFKIGELAEYLKISKSTLYKLAQEGKLPGQKVGKHWRFHRDAVEVWLKERSLGVGATHGSLNHGRLLRGSADEGAQTNVN